MNPFPSIYEERYYVYCHTDPNTKEIVYVGHGCGARAWISDPPFRSELHCEWLSIQEKMGYNPSKWVRILHENLFKTKACEIERRLIKFYKPRYNKIQGAALLKVSPEILEEAFSLRSTGLTYSEIAKTLNLATMTIHRAMKGKSPALEEILERTK